ncbi:hypothetical protein [Rubrivivax sp. JA1026]|uniref:hypothetical protein n=1 Tax=Rubrivivax sp. JA1026 TaxID=2710888 RepID=UPI0013E97E96|nr:hypothetical protein [Rubrivivax sp. JA1026]
MRAVDLFGPAPAAASRHCDRKRRRFNQYGRVAIGQRVRFERLELAPGCQSWGRDACTVTICSEHVVTEICESESGALVTLVDADGDRIRRCFDGDGQLWGGFGGLDVLSDAPLQASIPTLRRTA